ncbi:MAG TPA: protein kinase [Kofleriaceae bacterium]|nr:protein kinase [Kofleriaceae bacterium]
MVDRDGGSGREDDAGPKTELDLSAAAAAAVAHVEAERAAGREPHDETLEDPPAVEGSVRLAQADIDEKFATVHTESRPLHVTPRRKRTSPYAPTEAFSDLTIDSADEFQRQDDEELPPGTVLASRYDVSELVGQGGMGTVYAAHDDDLDEDIALKVLRSDLARDLEFQRKLRAEVRLARRVSHPNVCRVHDLGVADELVFVTMELVRGHTLRDQLGMTRTGAAEPFDLARIVDIILQIGAALATAHRASVIHRDVKPDNVILADGRAVLTDFGVASMALDRNPRAIAGTPAYLAPEVLRLEPFDHRVDIYALACTAYELIAGVPPWPLRTIEAATQVANDRPPYPGLPEQFASPSVRIALDRVLARGVASDPAMRTASIDRFTDAFAHAARGAPLSVALTGRFTGEAPSQVVTTPPVPVPRRAELRLATALMWRTDRARLDGEVLERVVVDAGGTPIRVGPSEIGALFGASRSTGDDAERAAGAALELIGKFGGRAGLDTTRVLLRPGVTELAGPDSIATASMIADEAEPGELRASPATGRQLAARYQIEPTADGTARRVVGVHEIAGEIAVESYRAAELAAIDGHIERAFRERTPVFVEVRGGAGSGKTRLRKAVVAAVSARREVEWMIGATSPSGAPAPLETIRRCSRDWYDELVANAETDAAQRDAATRWLVARATQRPVAVIIEDVQWADPSSRQLLDHVRVQLQAAETQVPIVVLTLGRGSGRAPAGVELVTLGPLGLDNATQLARSILPAARPEEIASIVNRGAGNPFFIEELAHAIASGTATSALPASIEAMVQARLDELPDDANQVANAAAVIGHAFWRKLVSRLVPHLGEAELDAALGELERAGIIEAVAPAVLDDERYQFTQGLVHDVAYSRVPSRERRQRHTAIAGWLEEQARRTTNAGAPTATVIETPVLLAIAHHREQAGDSARASSAYRQAGRRCLDVFAYGEATAALRKAVALAAAPDPLLEEELGDAVSHTEGHAAAEPIYQRALDETDDDDAAVRARLWYKLGHAASRRGVGASATARYRAGLALAAPGGRPAQWAESDPRIVALLWGGLGWTLAYQMGRVEEGQAFCERAVGLLEHTAHRRELAQALSRLGGAYMRACRFADQRSCNERNLAIAIELGDLHMQLTAQINLGVVHGIVGDLDRAIASTEAARALAIKMGATASEALAASNLAGLLIERGELDQATALLDFAIDALERTGTRYALSEALAFRARIAAARGELATAQQHAERALSTARSQANHLGAAVALRLLAQLKSLGGDHAAARATIEEALALAQPNDRFEALRTRAALGQILARAGDPASASVLADVRAEFERLGTARELAVIGTDDVR